MLLPLDSLVDVALDPVVDVPVEPITPTARRPKKSRAAKHGRHIRPPRRSLA